eukprot:SAG11_NODE_161_length_14021_cov_36.845065_9_plen_77_part_00
MGRMDGAQAAFQAAEEEAVRNQYWMLAALAVRDLVKHVLDPTGQSAVSGRKQCVAHVKKLTGSVEGIAALLGAEYM